MTPRSWCCAAVALATLGAAERVAGQSSWVLLQWTGPDGEWRSIEYDLGGMRGLAGTWTITLRRDRLTAMRQDSVIIAGEHPWTRQEIELDCTDEIRRVVRWEARDETGTLLASGGSAGWLPIRATGSPRALERRLCPWP